MNRQTKKDLGLMFKLVPVILIIAWLMISFLHKTPDMVKGVEGKISGKIKKHIDNKVNSVRSEEEKNLRQDRR